MALPVISRLTNLRTEPLASFCPSAFVVAVTGRGSSTRRREQKAHGEGNFFSCGRRGSGVRCCNGVELHLGMTDRLWILLCRSSMEIGSFWKLERDLCGDGGSARVPMVDKVHRYVCYLQAYTCSLHRESRPMQSWNLYPEVKHLPESFLDLNFQFRLLEERSLRHVMEQASFSCIHTRKPASHPTQLLCNIRN